MRLLLICLVAAGFAIEPSEALERLKEGNDRYMKDQLLHPNNSMDRREEIVSGQSPFATIVGCSDSRVSPEIIFDQGLGDLFIVRVAGNVVGPVELDSIDYSVEHLGSNLVVVLGHEACGAVTAVLKGKTEDIEDVAALIRPAIKNIKNVEQATKANVRWIVSKLKETPVVKDLISRGKVRVVGGYYHLGTGQVELL